MVCQIGSLSDQVIPRPPNIEPKVVLKWQAVQLAFFCHLREDLLLNHAESFWDPIEYGHIEQINTGVDLVADEVIGLLNEGVHSAGLIRDNDPESTRIFNRRQHYAALSSVLLVEQFELLKRVIADNITVEHKEQSLVVILPQYVLR